MADATFDMMRLGAFIQALLAAALFGMATPFSKTLLSGLQENQLAGLLYLGAAVFLAPGMLRARRRGAALPAGDRRNQLYLLGAIFFGGIVGPVLLLLGLRFSQAASVSMWLNLETVATAVLAALLFKEHLGKWTWLGTAGVVLSGALLSVQGGRAGVMGILCVGGACIAWGLDNNFTASIDAITPQASTFWKGLVAGTTNLAIGLTFFLWQPGWDWVWALALGGVSYGASIVLYIASAQRLGAARSQMVFASSPFFGVLLSVIWLGETLSPIQIAAAFILAGSVGLMLLERHEHEHRHEATTHRHAHRHDDEHHAHRHPGSPVDQRHSHEHAHQPVCHSHPHWPDLHHRHVH